nr:hypothetical protein CFP56_23233 [Quercus suber]
MRDDDVLWTATGQISDGGRCYSVALRCCSIFRSGCSWEHPKHNVASPLVSDLKLQINARFTSLRPASRTRDYTWIQALGVLFDTKTFSLEAITAATWDDEVDHLKFSYNGRELVIREGHLYAWKSLENDLIVERTSNKNSVVVTLPELAEISVNVVPVTKEDDRIHNY